MTDNAGLGASRQHVVSQRLRLRRRNLGLTQQQVVARLADLGVLTTNKAVSALERGAGIDVAKLPELARALDCSVTYLLGLSDDPGRWDPDKDAEPPAHRSPTRRASTPVERTASWILGPHVPDRSDRIFHGTAAAHQPVPPPTTRGSDDEER